MAYIKYRIYKNNNRAAGKQGKFYARAYHDETIGLEELSEHMSRHNTPYSKGTIHGVLKDMVVCVRELLLDSKKVKLDNLAIFSLGLKTTPADSAETFTTSANIVKAYINALGTGDISKKQLDVTARFKEVAEYGRGTEGSDNVPGTPSDGGASKGDSTPSDGGASKGDSTPSDGGASKGDSTPSDGGGTKGDSTPSNGGGTPSEGGEDD